MECSHARVDPDAVPEDLLHVSLAEPRQVQFWKHYFHASEQRLRAAVSLMGPAVTAVRSYLRRIRTP